MSQLIFLAMVWPTFVNLTKPLLYVVHHSAIFVWHVVLAIDNFIWRFSSWIGMAIPLFAFWRNQYAMRRDDVGSPPFLVLIFGFTVISAALHASSWLLPYWNFLSSMLGSMAPWLSIVTHTFLVLVAFLLLLGAVGAFGCRPMFSNSAPALFGPPAIMIAANICRYTLIGEFDWVKRLAISLGIYLVSFIFLLPILGQLSLRRRLLDTLVYLFRYVIIYHSWAIPKCRTTELCSVANFLASLLIGYTHYMVGSHFSVHPVLYSAHAIVVLSLYFATVDFTANIVGFSVFWSGLTLCYGLPYLNLTPLFTMIFAVIFGVCIGPFNFMVIFPILAPLFASLAFLMHKIGMLRLLDRARAGVMQVTNSIGRAWEGLLQGSFDDRSSFNTMFGWVGMTTFLAIFLIQGFSMLFLSGRGPLAAIAAQSFSDYLPSIQTHFEYIPVQRDGFGITTLSNRTQAHNATLEANLTSGMANATSSSSPFAAIASSPWYLALYLIDALSFLSIAFSALIFFGKFTSRCSALVLAGATFFFSFATLRKVDLLLCNYIILTEIIATELSIILAFTLPPCIYVGTKSLLQPYLPRLAPLICIPFERLWSMQQWLFRLAFRQWLAVLVFFHNTWDILFGNAPPPQNTQPKYVRPRRYG
jgi:hypothetical protein